MVSAIILAAGLSSRFGSPKPLAKLKDEPIIKRIERILISSSVSEVIIVLGADKDAIKPFLLNHTKVKVVYNKDYNLGQTVSFQCGLAATRKETKGFLLWPVDYPLIQGLTIEALCEIFLSREPGILIPTFEGRRGHPPIFHSRLQKELQALSASKGLNQISLRHESETVLLPVSDPGVVQSFNTVKEFHNLSA